MAHHHHHDHHHHHGHGSFRRLTWTLILVLGYMLAEVIGGILSHSLALLADAGHMLSDAAALGVSLFALWIARRPPDPRRTYGYYRAEILAALLHGVTLVVIAIFILREAWERLLEPATVRGGLMMGIAFGGLVVNLIGLAVLHGGRHDSLNMRGAWLHVLTDTLGSVQVIVAGVLIMAFGWTWADPAASILIALLVAWSSWSLLRESVDVLMESVPKHLDSAQVGEALLGIDGVEQVHDLHIWTLASGRDSLSAHVHMEGRPSDELLREIHEHLRRHFGLEHVTIQLETEPCSEGGMQICCGKEMPPPPPALEASSPVEHGPG